MEFNIYENNKTSNTFNLTLPASQYAKTSFDGHKIYDGYFLLLLTDIGDYVPPGGTPDQKYILLGTSFLKPYYTLFDTANSRVGFIPANVDDGADLDDDAFKVILGAIALIIVSLVVSIVYIKCKKRKKEN